MSVVDGIVGRGRRFEANKYFNLGPVYYTNITFLAFLNKNAQQEMRVASQWGAAVGEYGHYLRIVWDGRVQTHWSNNGTNDLADAIVNQYPGTGVWHMVGYSYRKLGNYYHAYLNEATGSGAAGGPYFHTAADFYIGRQGALYVNGVLDEVYIFDELEFPPSHRIALKRNLADPDAWYTVRGLTYREPAPRVQVLFW